MRTLATAAVVGAVLAGTAQGDPVQDALRAAAAFRGPLEGGWRIETPGGRPLYALRLADPGGQPDPGAASPATPAVEGAWRDLGRPADRTASGVLDHVERQAGVLSFAFSEGQPTRAVKLVLRPSGHGLWRGWLSGDGGRTRVVMRREAR